ncbi:DUF2391 family protein [Halosegnis marinus]|uniref:DUF2391 family protein n=2 Tax=Halosegnis marinus TaxID=3034023 RepID=A0ABD5ZT15_9EURY|nr:DUF2391 family protein [Halosegnis sp. DT85]
MSTDDYVSTEEARPEDIVDDLADLRAQVADPEARAQVNDLMEQVADLQPRGLGNVIVGFDRTDLAEAALGALLFGIPMFVEGGTNEVGAFVADRPLAFVGTLVAAVLLVYGIVYVADFQDVRVHEPLFGLVPRRLAGVVGASFLVAALGMTLWGRVDWTSPWLAVCTVSVAFVPMSIGAALGDIIPGS